MRTVFIATCWIPIALFIATSVYLRQFDGLTAGFAAPVLVPALLLSLGFGIAGVRFVHASGDGDGSDPLLIGATIVAFLPIAIVIIRRLI